MAVTSTMTTLPSALAPHSTLAAANLSQLSSLLLPPKFVPPPQPVNPASMATTAQKTTIRRTMPRRKT